MDLGDTGIKMPFQAIRHIKVIQGSSGEMKKNQSAHVEIRHHSQVLNVLENIVVPHYGLKIDFEN